MSDRRRRKKTRPANDRPPDEKPVTPTGPQEPVPERPGLQQFDRWIQKRLIWAMGGVIVVAFLFKTFVPVRYGFSLGLLAGVLLLLAIYLIDFYRR